MNLQGRGTPVSISTPDGEPLYHGFAKLDTYTEGYKAHIDKILTKGETRVTACHLPKGTDPQEQRPRLYLEVLRGLLSSQPGLRF